MAGISFVQSLAYKYISIIVNEAQCPDDCPER